MKIDINKKDLWDLRDIIRRERDRVHVMYVREDRNACALEFKQREDVANKVIRKLNTALKKAYGHDCLGEAYLQK